jgi:hypothetical protein
MLHKVGRLVYPNLARDDCPVNIRLDRIESVLRPRPKVKYPPNSGALIQDLEDIVITLISGCQSGSSIFHSDVDYAPHLEALMHTGEAAQGLGCDYISGGWQEQSLVVDQEATAIAWDESFGRLCVALPDRTVVMTDFGRCMDTTALKTRWRQQLDIHLGWQRGPST